MSDTVGKPDAIATTAASHLGPYAWDVAYILIGLAVGALLWLLGRSVVSRRIAIEPFGAPKALEELGWTGLVLAHQLDHAIRTIQQQSKSSKENEEFQRPGDARDYVTIAAGGGRLYLSICCRIAQRTIETGRGPSFW